MSALINSVIKQAFEPYYLPCHLHRQIENDLPAKKDSFVQRTCKVAIPLLMLYKPFSKPISLGMGGFRAATHLLNCHQAKQDGKGWQFVTESTQFGLAAVSLAASWNYLPLGVFFTTGADIVTNLGKIIYFYRQQNYNLITEELVQLTGSSFYMACLLSSSYYVLFASIVVQGLINLYHARKEWNEGKKPEAFTQLIVAGFRCHEAKQKWDVIQQQKAFKAQQEATLREISKRLDAFLAEIDAKNKLKAASGTSKEPVIIIRQENSGSNSQAKVMIPPGILKRFLEQPQNRGFRAMTQLGLAACTLNGEPLDPRLQILANAVNDSRINRRLHSFPLQNFQNVNDQANDNGNQQNFGFNIHGYGRTLVKEFNLCFRDKTRGSEELIELDFDINHVYREQLDDSISSVSNRHTRLQMTLLSYLTGSSVGGVRVKEGIFEMGGFRGQQAYNLDFGRAGSILVGSDPEVAGMHNRVFVRIPKKCTPFQLHEMLSSVGLENVLKRFTPADLERLKIGSLFRHFHPGKATLFERTSQFFKLSINQLKTAIVGQFPDMKDRFEQDMPKFRPYEILPGRVRYGIEGIGRRCYELGARSLIATIHQGPDTKKFCNRIVSIIQTGMLSSELRFANHINTDGLSPDQDVEAGSADSVFTQLAIADDYQGSESPSMGRFGYFSPTSSIALEFDLDILDTLPYQYHTDSLGTRNLAHDSSTYLGRPNLYDFVTEEVNSNYRHNEVMIRDRIPSSYIRGILVSDNGIRESLHQHLNESGLIQSNQDGIDTILGIPVNQFIRTPATTNRYEDHYSAFRQTAISSL